MLKERLLGGDIVNMDKVRLEWLKAPYSSIVVLGWTASADFNFDSVGECGVITMEGLR